MINWPWIWFHFTSRWLLTNLEGLFIKIRRVEASKWSLKYKLFVAQIRLKREEFTPWFLPPGISSGSSWNLDKVFIWLWPWEEADVFLLAPGNKMADIFLRSTKVVVFHQKSTDLYLPSSSFPFQQVIRMRKITFVKVLWLIPIGFKLVWRHTREWRHQIW